MMESHKLSFYPKHLGEEIASRLEAACAKGSSSSVFGGGLSDAAHLRAGRSFQAGRA